MTTNPPLERRWTAHSRQQAEAISSEARGAEGTQTPPMQTLQGHAERHGGAGQELRHCSRAAQHAEQLRGAFSPSQLVGRRKEVGGREQGCDSCHGRTSFISPMPEHRGSHLPSPPAPSGPTTTTGRCTADSSKKLHDGDASSDNATGNRIGNSCAKRSGHHATEDYLEQQEGEGFRATEDTASRKANCSIGAATDPPCGAQTCGKSDTAQGRTSPTTGCQLGRLLGARGPTP